MEIGDKRKEIPEFSTTYGNGQFGVPTPCRVVYIHPEERFYTVEFRSELTGETFRGSYFMGQRRTLAEREADKHENDRNIQPERRRGKDHHGSNYGPRFGKGAR